MRPTLTALALVGLLLAACGTSRPGTPAPTVLGTQAPPAATQAPMDPVNPPPPAMPHY